MTAVSFLPAAEEEMIESARYYESKCERLGGDFLAEINHAVKSIQDHPTSARYAFVLDAQRLKVVGRHLPGAGSSC